MLLNFAPAGPQRKSKVRGRVVARAGTNRVNIVNPGRGIDKKLVEDPRQEF